MHMLCRPDPAITAPTQLKVPVTWRYQTGLGVSISPAGVAQWNMATTGPAAAQNTTLEITITEVRQTYIRQTGFIVSLGKHTDSASATRIFG